MANDFKRMWTNEELKSNSVLDLPDIPEVVDANSPDIIRVQGKLYYRNEITKDNVDNLTNTTWLFKEVLTLPNDDYFYSITFKSNNTMFNELDVGSSFVEYYGDENNVNAYSNTWHDRAYRTITITWGNDVENAELIAFLQENATLLETIYTYVEVGADEDLVKSIPTDVSIIEDQGKLELMLEHDGNVLAINDTPNQFLQRRLDKVSFYYNPYDEPPQYDSLGECLADNLDKLHKGMFVQGNITYGNITTYSYYIITSVDTLTINMVPISPIPTTLNNMTGFVSEVSIRLDGSTWQYKVTGFTGDNEYATLVDISIIDSIYFY